MVSPTVLNVRYATFDEPLRVTPFGAGSLVRLAEPSVHAPLTEGDVVSHADGLITGVVRPTPYFIVEAFLPVMCDQWQLDERLARWGTATLVVQTSPCTLRVRSQSWDWLVDVVEGDPEVEVMLVLRRPDDRVDLVEAVRKAGGPVE